MWEASVFGYGFDVFVLIDLSCTIEGSICCDFLFVEILVIFFFFFFFWCLVLDFFFFLIGGFDTAHAAAR